jgi:YgiT-type zinc finger domain-containing protein
MSVVSCVEGRDDERAKVPQQESGNMSSDRLEAGWRELSEDVVTGMAEWRAQHPKATLDQIETALDERLGGLRARMLQDAALASEATDLRETPTAERPRCPQCGTPLTHQSWEKRDLLTHHGHTVTLKRSYAVCPTCGEAFFPPR